MAGSKVGSWCGVLGISLVECFIIYSFQSGIAFFRLNDNAHSNSLTAVSVYIRPDHSNCAKKIVKNQPFLQKSPKIHQNIEN